MTTSDNDIVQFAQDFYTGKLCFTDRKVILIPKSAIQFFTFFYLFQLDDGTYVVHCNSLHEMWNYREPIPKCLTVFFAEDREVNLIIAENQEYWTRRKNHLRYKHGLCQDTELHCSIEWDTILVLGWSEPEYTSKGKFFCPLCDKTMSAPYG